MDETKNNILTEKIRISLLSIGIVTVMILSMTAGAFTTGIAGLILGIFGFFYCKYLFLTEIKMLATFECPLHKEKLKWGLTSLKGTFREHSYKNLKKKQFPWSGIRTNSEKGSFSMKVKLCTQCTEDEIHYIERREQAIEKTKDWLILSQSESGAEYFIDAIKIHNKVTYKLNCSFSQFAHFLSITKGDKHEYVFGLMIIDVNDPKSISEAVLKVTSSNIEENINALNELDLENEKGIINLQKIYSLLENQPPIL